MKKKWLIAALAAVLVVQGGVAFGAGSSSSDDNDVVVTPPAEDTNQPQSPIIVAGSGEKTEVPVVTPEATTPVKEVVTVPAGSGAAGPGSASQITIVRDTNQTTGSSIGVVVDTTTSTGIPITTNEKGDVVIGDTVVTFADTNTVAALPAPVASAIEGINTGKPLQETVADVNLEGYNALTSAHTITTTDAATGQVKTGPVEVSVYVPNLVGDLGEVSVLFYDNATGKWILLPVVKTDMASKTVAVTVPGSGTLSVVYKK